MQRSDFHYELPAELIARYPATPRSSSRLLELDGASGALRDRKFSDLPQLLTAKDLLVLNDTRVIPARVYGTKESGGRIELLLERVLTSNTALVHARAGKGLRPQVRISLPGGHWARMLERCGEFYRLEFSADALEFFESHGEVPLPPYIERTPDAADRECYQTVYARAPGAVAAPTAGLHFDADTFAALARRGVRHAFLTLHVGAGTFQPVRVDDLDEHEMHPEYLEVPQATCDAIEAARVGGGRVVAVGTTVVRSLESAAAGGTLKAYRGSTRLFIQPGYAFRAVDALITNFHLPESTLLMLCAAFVGRERLLAAYAHAIEERYRFFSYGDASLLTPGADALPARGRA